jgi:hypothetical protein
MFNLMYIFTVSDQDEIDNIEPIQNLKTNNLQTLEMS